MCHPRTHNGRIIYPTPRVLRSTDLVEREKGRYWDVDLSQIPLQREKQGNVNSQLEYSLSSANFSEIEPIRCEHLHVMSERLLHRILDRGNIGLPGFMIVLPDDGQD